MMGGAAAPCMAGIPDLIRKLPLICTRAPGYVREALAHRDAKIALQRELCKSEEEIGVILLALITSAIFPAISSLSTGFDRYTSSSFVPLIPFREASSFLGSPCQFG